MDKICVLRAATWDIKNSFRTCIGIDNSGMSIDSAIENEKGTEKKTENKNRNKNERILKTKQNKNIRRDKNNDKQQQKYKLKSSETISEWTIYEIKCIPASSFSAKLNWLKLIDSLLHRARLKVL